MRALVFCLSLRACASLSEFDAWKVEYGKVYALVEEEAAASRAFYENDAMIKEQNAKNLSFWLGHNEFSDLSHENFASTHLGLVPRSADYVSRAIFQPPVEHHHHHHHGPPPPVDWVAKGKVTPVKNQCVPAWARPLRASPSTSRRALTPLPWLPTTRCPRAWMAQGRLRLVLGILGDGRGRGRARYRDGSAPLTLRRAPCPVRQRE